MGRSPCCAKEGLNRGAWTAMEDKMLTDYIKLHGEGKWRNLPIKAGLKRCGKSCRLRWLNYLKPDIKRGNITRDEEDLIIRLHNLLGNRWSLIAGRLPGRTDNEIKNYWNTNIGKKCTTHHEEHHNYDDHRRRQTTRRHKLSQQRHQKKKKKTPVSSSSHHKKSSTPIIAGAGPIPIAIPSSNVVRTKATRCTKVFIQHTNTIIPDPLNSTSTNHHQQQQHHLPITFPMNHNNTSPQNDIIINHTTTNHPHPQSLNNHTHHPPQPNDDLMMDDLEISDTFLTNVMAMDDTTPPTTDHFSSFNTLNYTNHLHPQDGPPEHNTHILNDDNHDRYLSSSSLSFDDDGFFLKDDDDMMTKMMEAAAQLDDDTNNNNNNWFTAFLGTGDIDFDATHPTD